MVQSTVFRPLRIPSLPTLSQTTITAWDLIVAACGTPYLDFELPVHTRNCLQATRSPIIYPYSQSSLLLRSVSMRAAILTVALLACLVPGFAQTTAGCTSAASLPPALAANLTGEINEALLPKADQTYTNSTTKGYVSFTTPAICYNGNWFGYNVIPKGCLPNVGGKTYQGSTGKTVSVSGIYGLKVNITAQQTACTNTNGVVTSSSAMTVTATWPTITLISTLDWYPLSGKEANIGITLTVTGMKMVMQGSYTYTATKATKQSCFTQASVSSTVITYTGISGTWTINGAYAGNLPTKVVNKVGSAIQGKGGKVTASVNAALTENVVGTCKTTASG